MADFIDYGQILLDFKNGVTGADLGFAKVFTDANARDYLMTNMPLLDLRVKTVDPQAVTNATYFSDLIIEGEICAYHLTSREEAAKLRNDLTNKLHRWVKDNPRFAAAIETTTIGRGEFGTGESKEEGAFVAGVVLEFHVQLYTE